MRPIVEIFANVSPSSLATIQAELISPNYYAGGSRAKSRMDVWFTETVASEDVRVPDPCRPLESGYFLSKKMRPWRVRFFVPMFLLGSARSVVGRETARCVAVHVRRIEN